MPGSTTAAAPVESAPAGTWPAGGGKILIYRLAPQPMGSSNGVSLWVRGDGTDVNLRIRLLCLDPNTTTDETVMFRPMWISGPISVKSTDWQAVMLPRSSFTLHYLHDAPSSIDPHLPPDAQPPVPAPDSPLSFSDVNAIAIEATVPWHSTFAVDDINWATFDDSGVPSNLVSVDDFELGNVAAWSPLGDPAAKRMLTYGIITKAGWVHHGRVAFKLTVLSPAARRKGDLMSGAKRVMAVTHQTYMVFEPESLFTPILPSTLPEPGGASSSVTVQMCPDQTQAATFCLYTQTALSNVTATLADDLHGIGRVLPKSDIDITVVKVLDRLGAGPLRNPDEAGPQPELLVKDDRVPLSGLAPDIRLTGDPTTDIPADTTKQFWLTISLPHHVVADTYTGTIRVTADGAAPIEVPITVTVLPLRLLNADKQYAINLRSRLDPAPATLPASDGSAFATDFVTADQLNRQLADIYAHGIRYISINDPESTLWAAYQARATAGFLPPYVYTGSADPQQVDTERAAHQAPEFIYFQPPVAGRQVLDVLGKKSLPAATYIEGPDDYASLQADLDTVIYYRDGDYPEQLLRTHGNRISPKHDWWYWNATDEDPHSNRVSTGLLLQRAHLYGAYLPEYQLCLGSDPYDDSSAGAPDRLSAFRPEMLTYPAATGVIDTVKWEAVREGITDERYLTTMFAALRECKDDHIQSAVAKQAQVYFNTLMDKPLTLLTDSEYDAARAQIASFAVTLRTAADAYSKKNGNN